MAFGEIGLTPYEYYSMTRAEFILTIKGYQNKQAKEALNIREIVYGIYATQFGRKKRMPSKNRFWPNPLDRLTLDSSEEEMRIAWKKLKNKSA